MPARRMSDWDAYFEAKSKLPEPDGIHCIICGADLPKRRRKYCSHECWLNWFRSLKIIDWNDVKKEALERDDYTCQKCGFKPKNKRHENGRRLEVHHIIPCKDGGESLDVNNCTVLCSACHVTTHRELRKQPGDKLN